MINEFATVKIGCSNAACRYLFGNTDFKTVYNAIDLSRFDTSLYEIKDDDGKNHFLNVGRYSAQKNQLFLLDVFLEIIKREPHSELTLIGFGPDEQMIREKIIKLGLLDNVRMLPHDSCIPEIMYNSDHLLFPSRYEGLGIVVIEAQAAGLHCFVSEAVPKEADLGNCTYISIKENAEQWAESILGYIRENGSTRKYVDMTAYNIENVVKSYDRIYSGSFD